MATRVIKYIPKNTGAGTEYRECDPDDLAWIQTQLVRYVAVMGELDQNRDDDSKWVRDQWWHKRTDKVHKGQLGQNTPCSIISGMINNMMFKTPPQRDLTNKQMEDIEYVSAIMGNCYEGLQPIRFQIGFGS